MHAITEQQVAYFETFGFLVLRQAFDVDEMAAFGARFDEMLPEDRGGSPFPGARPSRPPPRPPPAPAP